ncbi:MAG: chitobiase/beta-hexosaminidase C-terminal domain-containing protein, partial [Prolixibacteraceae bacterium]|nr:chitobiase/beta-hexosaminidase C-terminal domain-containing protein [Prolixibacteraceae bacterium]
ILLAVFNVSAETLLADFENGSLGSWESWGAPVSVEENPSQVGNTSNFVALLDQSGGAWNGFKQWDNNSALTPITIKVAVDVYFKNNSGTFKLQMDNSISGAANYEQYIDIDSNTWVSVEFDLSDATVLDYRQIAFQSSVADSLFLDNIKLIEGDPIDLVLGDFEDGTTQNWSTWGAPIGSVDNPDTIGNNSSKVLSYDQSGGGWSGIAKWNDTPVFSENFGSIAIDAYFTTEKGVIKLQLDNSISGAKNVELYSDSILPGAWANVVFDLSNFDTLDFKQIAFQSPNPEMIYVDNILLKLVNNTSQDLVDTPVQITSSVISSSQINVEWSKNEDMNDVVIAFSESVQTGNPTNELVYTIGDTITDCGTVVYVGSDTTFTHINLESSKDYYYKIWSVNESNIFSEGLTTEAKTYAPEPATHVTNFASNSSTLNSISLTWTDDSSVDIAEGYVIYISTSESLLPIPVDGVETALDLDLSDGIGAVIVDVNERSFEWDGLNSSTNYYISIYPYANALALIDYKIEGAPSIIVETLKVVEDPVFDVVAGEYADSVFVVISCETEGASIYYTIDGTEPTIDATMYSSPFKLEETTTVKVVAIFDGFVSDVIESVYVISNEPIVVTDPIFDPASGEFIDSVIVSISCETEGALIYYTLDGTEPTVDAAMYSSTFKLEETTTVKAVAIFDGFVSDVIESVYVISNEPIVIADPIFDPASGEFIDSVIVSISCETEGVSIYFTLDGTEPTINSLLYSAPIKLEETATIKALAIIDETSSNVVEAIYTIVYTPIDVSEPVFTPEGGDFEDSVVVSLSCATEGAIVYYSTDGTDPTNASMMYANPFVVSETASIKAIAIVDGEQSEIVEQSYTIYIVPTDVATIAELRNGIVGDELYRFTGNAVVSFAMEFRNQVYIQDETGGILIDDLEGVITEVLSEGQHFGNLTGKLVDYNGLLEISPAQNVDLLIGDMSVAEPVEVSVSDLTSNFEAYESELVLLKHVRFENPGIFENGNNYQLNSDNGNILLRAHFYDVDYIGNNMLEGIMNLTGIALWDNNEAKIVPRNANDISDATGIEEYFNNITIYAYESNIVVQRELDTRAEIRVINASGQLVLRKDISETLTEIRIAKPGLYFVQYINSNKILKTAKLNIQ